MLDCLLTVLTYNSNLTLEETLNSLVSQDFIGKWKIFISDDCSTDETVQTIKKYKRKFPDLIDYEVNKVNLGVAKNLFNAINSYDSEFIFSIAGDDFLIDNSFLTKKNKILKSNNSLSFSFSNGYKFHSDYLNDKKVHLGFEKEFQFDIRDWINDGFFPINVQTLFMRRSALPSPFPSWFYTSEQEDWLLLFFLMLHGKGQYCHEFSSMYRQHEKNYTSQGYTLKMLEGGLQLIKNLNNYTNGSYKKDFGSNFWRYERLVFASFHEKKVLKFFKYLFIIPFVKSLMKQKIIFVKTLFKVLFKGYKVSF